MVKKVLAVIPARGGSKRIPKKNIIDFCGKPMIAWTIQAACETGIFEDVFVSTDSQEIADKAIKYGASVPFLRDKYADDYAASSDVTLYALNELEKKIKKKYDIVMQLMPNCPLRGSGEILAAYQNFIKEDARFQISCFKFGWMNPWWSCQLEKNGAPNFMFPEGIKKRSQDLPDLFCPTGAMWVARTDALKKEKTFYGKNLTFFPLDLCAAVDIDDYDDLEFAKVLYANREKARK